MEEQQVRFVIALTEPNANNIITSCYPAVHGGMGCSQKSFKVVWRCHQLPSGFLVNDTLRRVLRLSANDKGDNEITSGAMYRYPSIYITPEENLS